MTDEITIEKQRFQGERCFVAKSVKFKGVEACRSKKQAALNACIVLINKRESKELKDKAAAFDWLSDQGFVKFFKSGDEIEFKTNHEYKLHKHLLEAVQNAMENESND